jgi:hypothetical protein
VAARARLAAGIYRALPEHERASISSEMAERLGDLWFGNPAAPDEDAATQPAHAATLSATLARRGHLPTADSVTEIAEEEPLEATFARRSRPLASRPGSIRQRVTEPIPLPRIDPQPRPVPQPARAPEPS